MMVPDTNSWPFFFFSCILTMSLFQVIDCLWWRLAILQAARMLRSLTSIFYWMFHITAILSY